MRSGSPSAPSWPGLGGRVSTMDDLTYDDVGATRHGPLPPGYRHLRYHTYLGPVSFADAAEAVLSFAMHRAYGQQVVTSTPRAVVGTLVSARLGLGPLGL